MPDFDKYSEHSRRWGRPSGQIVKKKRATLVRHFKSPLEPSKRAEKLSHMMFRKILYFGCPTNSVWARSYDHLKIDLVRNRNPFTVLWWEILWIFRIFRRFWSLKVHLEWSYGLHTLSTSSIHLLLRSWKYEPHTTILSPLNLNFSFEILTWQTNIGRMTGDSGRQNDQCSNFMYL